MTLTFDSIAAPWWPYVFILIAGALATNFWRWFGVLAGGLLKEDSEGIVWVRAVAVAMAGAVIGNLVIFPSGALTATPMPLRVAALAAGWLAFRFAGRSILLGVLVGEAALVASSLLFAR